MIDQPEIRGMQEADIGSVLLNEQRSYTHPWNQRIIEDCIANGNDCWVLGIGEHIIGHGIISIAAGEAHLLNVCVNPDFQGNGYGRELVMHLIKQARSRAANRMFLEVRVSNQIAYQLYEKLGFNEVGVRADYYPSLAGREDAIVLAIELI